MNKRKVQQAKRGREVYIVEVDGYPDTDRRHAYRTRGIAKAAARFRDGSTRVVRYLPAAGEP